MASNVVVIDNTARKHVIKTTPTTSLSDVLQQACAKIGVDSSQYGLKHGEKTVDLSRNIRMSGLSPGAKLTLVQASKSPAVVSIALQLPPTSESAGSLARLKANFPSNTPLWQILRRFESGVAGGEATKQNTYNFTQRATPMMSGQTGSGSGRLCYEMPVLNIMSRDFASFIGLQKTLAQVGLTSGTALLRLSYRNTERPLEEAMAEISTYFADLEEPVQPTGTKVNAGALATGPADMQSAPDLSSAARSLDEAQGKSPPPDSPMPDAPTAADTVRLNNSDVVTTSSITEPGTVSTAHLDSQPSPATAGGISFFRAPTSNTPAAVAAIANHDENDYIPTIVHAQQHQARLNQESRNRRLKSDKELEAEAETRATALAEVKSITVRLRFPDQSQAQQPFGPGATAADLYGMCREVMDLANGRNAILLRGPSAKGAGTTQLKESKERLIADLGWRGRVLVTVVWGEEVSADARTRPALKEEYRRQAEEMKIDLPVQADEPTGPVNPTEPQDTKGKGKEKKQLSAEDRENRLRKLMGKMGGRK